MRLEPVFSDTDIDFNRAIKGKGLCHAFSDNFSERRFFVGSEIEDELVVYLKDKAGL